MPRMSVRAHILVISATALALSACSLGAAGRSSPPAARVSAGPTTAAATPTAAPLPTMSVAVTVRAMLEGDLPKGWDVASEGPLLSFSTAGDGPGMIIELLRNRSVMAEDCALQAQPGVGTTAEAILAALGARHGLATTKPATTRVGGLSGRWVDIRVDSATGTTCPGDDGPFVPLFGAMEDYGWGFAGVGVDERMRLIALDVADDENLLILVAATDSETYDRHIAGAVSIIEHLAFRVGL